MQIPEYKERDELLLRLGFSSYELYLQSELWKQIKMRAYKAHGKKCRICGGDAEVLHHKNYRWEIMSGKSLKGLVPLCYNCHNIIEFSKTGWKRTLDGTNNKLAELTSAYTPSKKKPKPQKYELTAKQLKLRRKKCPPTKQEKRRKKTPKPRPNVCNTRAKVLEAEEKLAENRYKMMATRKAGSSPLARFM